MGTACRGIGWICFDKSKWVGHKGNEPRFFNGELTLPIGPGGIGYYSYGGKTERIYWQKGTPLEALRLYYLTEDGKCSDIPLEINLGKSYVAVVDVDEAINYETGLLADHDLAASDAATAEAEAPNADV